ncbi:ring finger domain-containing protein [Ditylenchus destructor]|uniref:Ring finger domain-containing protein n=1 Tax=Ditylenchus destructor TaxID=166010 RepID=A0AAD4R921_9BILA|nr:ring finger domain-containing protein [Ditylenchus destructor]
MSSSTPYFCHECNRRVAVNNALQCENCRGEFVEEDTGNENDQYFAQQGQEGGQGGQQGRRGMIYMHRGDDGDGGGTFVLEGPNPFQSMLQSNSPFARIFGQIINQHINRQTPSSSGSSAQGPNTSANEDEASSRGANTMNGGSAPSGDGLMQFINQLMANLAQGNEVPTRLTFQIGGDGEGSPFQLHGNVNDYAWGEGGIDHIVTQLLNQFEGGPEQHIRPEDLHRLPMTQVTQAQVDNGNQCATCMDTFKLNENVAQLECQHIFHRECIEPWLRKRNTCPICRSVVDPKNWGPSPEIADIDELD